MTLNPPCPVCDVTLQLVNVERALFGWGDAVPYGLRALWQQSPDNSVWVCEDCAFWCPAGWLEWGPELWREDARKTSRALAGPRKARRRPGGR